MVDKVISQLIGTVIPMHPRLRLLLDLEFYNLQAHKDLIANLLTAVTILIAKGWKSRGSDTGGLASESQIYLSDE